jgi:hypothetical protein
MAITTLDLAIAGVQPPQPILKVGATMEAAGVLHSLLYTSGAPGAAVAPTPGLGGAALTTYSGQIPRTNPASGNAHLMRLAIASTLSGGIYLLDRLWHNSGIVSTTTTAQTVNSVAFPARCIPASGSTPDANGGGILVGVEVSTATTNAAAITNMTMSYTNQAGTAGRTATIASFPATAAAGTFVLFQLQAGDTGVRSIQSITLGTSLVTGTVHMVAFRTLAGFGVLLANTEASVDIVTGGAVRLYDNSVPFLLWMPSAVTAVTIRGSYVETQG